MPPRRSTNSAEVLVIDLKRSVDVLLKENRALKRELQKLAERGVTLTRGRSADSVGTGLTRIRRQLERVLERPAPARTKKRASTTRARKPASPETTAKRLAALAKARAARAAKRADAATT